MRLYFFHPRQVWPSKPGTSASLTPLAQMGSHFLINIYTPLAELAGEGIPLGSFMFHKKANVKIYFILSISPPTATSNSLHLLVKFLLDKEDDMGMTLGNRVRCL